MKETNKKVKKVKALLLTALMTASMFGMAACQGGSGASPVVEPSSASSSPKGSSEGSKKTEEPAGKSEESASKPESSEESSKESSETPESSASLTGAELMGTWKVDIDYGMETAGAALYNEKFFKWTPEQAQVSDEALKPVWSHFLDIYRVVTLEDGTFRLEQDLLGSVLVRKEFYDVCVEAIAGLSIEEASLVTGIDVDTLTEKLESEGMTWKEYCEYTQKANDAMFEQKYEETKEALEKYRAGEEVSGLVDTAELSEDGTVISMTGTYEIKDGKIIAENDKHNARFTLSYSDGVQVLDDVKDNTEASEGLSSLLTREESVKMLVGARLLRA